MSLSVFISRTICLAACSSMCATPLKAQEATIKSVPRYYVLFSRTTNGGKRPQFTIRVDSYFYPAPTSYRQFLQEGAPRTPEALIARFFQVLLDPREDADAFAQLYSPSKRRTATDRKNLNEIYSDFHQYVGKIGEPKLKARYDFGRYSGIKVEFPNADRDFLKTKYGGLEKMAFSLAFNAIERDGDRAYLTGDWSPPGDAAFIGQLVFQGPPTTEAISLPYSLRIPNDSPATKNIHPVDVFFDGTALDVPLDGKTRTPNPAVNFLQHAAQVTRAGKISDILTLWDAPSAKDIRASLQPKAYTQTAYEEKKYLLCDTSRRIAFAMNSDAGAIIFLRSTKTKVPPGDFPVDLMFVYKQKDGYKLSFEPSPGFYWFNLEKLLRSPYFQDYLLKITAPKR